MNNKMIMAKTNTIDHLLIVVPGHRFLKTVPWLPLREDSQGLAIDELADKLREQRTLYNLKCLEYVWMVYARENFHLSVCLTLVTRSLVKNLHCYLQIRITVNSLPDSG